MPNDRSGRILPRNQLLNASPSLAAYNVHPALDASLWRKHGLADGLSGARLSVCWKM